jgi:hypothetical protein
LRKKIKTSVPRATLEQIAALRVRQLQLLKDITTESRRIITTHAGSRHFISNIGELEAIELLGTEIVTAGAPRPLRTRLAGALLAIKTAKAGTSYQIGDGVSITFTTRKFHVTIV